MQKHPIKEHFLKACRLEIEQIQARETWRPVSRRQSKDAKRGYASEMSIHLQNKRGQVY